MTNLQLDEVFAVPGQRSIVDVVHPVTGLGGYSGETLDQLQVKYPGAVRVAYTTWATEASARQQTPITWEPSTAERYEEMLNCLPPIAWDRGAFLVGEPSDHCVATGRARYQGYRQMGEDYFASSRPITVAELREALR